MVTRMGRCQLVVIKGPCLEAPGLSQVGGCHNLEVPPWDLPRPLGNPAGPPPLAVFRLLAHANCLSVSLFCRLFAHANFRTDML